MPAKTPSAVDDHVEAAGRGERLFEAQRGVVRESREGAIHQARQHPAAPAPDRPAAADSASRERRRPAPPPRGTTRARPDRAPRAGPAGAAPSRGRRTRRTADRPSMRQSPRSARMCSVSSASAAADENPLRSLRRVGVDPLPRRSTAQCRRRLRPISSPARATLRDGVVEASFGVEIQHARQVQGGDRGQRSRRLRLLAGPGCRGEQDQEHDRAYTLETYQAT